MSAITAPNADAPRGAGRIEAALDAFDAAETEQAPAAERQPAPSEQAQPPEPPTDGPPTPPRDERGRFTSDRPAETPAAPTTPPGAPAEAEPVDWKARYDEAEAARQKEANDRRAAEGRIEAERRRAEDLTRQAAQGEQVWRQQQEQRIAAERDRLRRDLDLRIARSPEATVEQIQEARDLLEGRFAIEDLARERAERQAERQGWQQTVAGVQQQDQRRRVSEVVPGVLTQYAAQMAARAQALHGVAVPPEEAAAFVADPHIREQYERAWVLPISPEAKEALVDAIETQQVTLLAQRSQLAAERRDFAAQQQLATNRTNATGSGATRELVPGAAGEGAPDYSRYRNSGNVAGALDAYEEDRQAGRAQ